jgi:hypothetical protein
MIGAAGLFAISSSPFQSCSEYDGWGFCWELKLWETESSYEIYMLVWQGKSKESLGDALMIPNCEKKIKKIKEKIWIKFSKMKKSL